MHAWLSVMMLVYGILQWYGMLVWYDVSMLCYGMLLYVSMVYDVNIIGYCRVCYCMILWYDVSIIGYCRVWYGILHIHAWLSAMMLVYVIYLVYGMVMMLKSWG